jgi:hypothetical protein
MSEIKKTLNLYLPNEIVESLHSASEKLNVPISKIIQAILSETVGVDLSDKAIFSAYVRCKFGSPKNKGQ